jgi:archaellum component FlaF (FlaF/FlaG flagellin family)
VLLRADSSGTAQTLTSAELIVDGATADTRTYSAAANNALQIGAVDQIYRADVLPTPHTVVLTAVVNGQTLSQTVNVTAQGQTVTYVQFAVRNGQLVPVTWTSRGTTPF